MRNLVLGVCLVLIFVLPACSTIPDSEPVVPGVVIDGVVIRNNLARPVTDVTILAVSTGNFVSCGNIMANSACSTGFPNRIYASNKLIVSWNELGQPQSTDEFVVELEAEIDLSRSARLEVLIFSPGQAGARLIQ